MGDYVDNDQPAAVAAPLPVLIIGAGCTGLSLAQGLKKVCSYTPPESAHDLG
ncbi:hypothetical protein M430DRAFT_19135 [Amorphotheca resinae ATCC 22711]|uniref:Uncharacterized protein n=1 Tax=Amorphotheca resinae ATCC 22711 TaxID=857342 RepID=A0A2T3B1U6_AMORE|nr:hypothetical protein M430DRAFT_19135 [Amorphotheca resinae ATCC 22711]PSS18535.1 hypothetical protein M430DRAFT_19135 [Amorphotheca resinae ATCC 22711]